MQTVHQYVNNISQQGSEDIPFPQLLRNMQQHIVKYLQLWKACDNSLL